MRSPSNGQKPQKLFGTDGIRGDADQFPFDDASLQTIGGSLAKIIHDRSGRPARFVTGRDTRESGDRIERALSTGIRRAGGSVDSAGVIPTPGVAFITGARDYDAGVVISASHNPFQDNGIKIFLPDGRKLDAEAESIIEAAVRLGQSAGDPEPAGGMEAVEATSLSSLDQAYVDHLLARFPGLSLSGLRVAIDCANGAASAYATGLFRHFGADVISINAEPDGRNINKNCGSLHLDALKAAVTGSAVDIGIAFDGDADRVLFVAEDGSVVDGDAILWVIGTHMLEQGGLVKRKVVATVMSNIGLELAFRSRGVELVRTDVGDKYVLDELIRSGSELGGEQSGHIIFPKESFVGDGMLTALAFLDVVAAAGQTKVSALAGSFERFPQVLVNVRVAAKRPFAEVAPIAAEAAELERRLAGSGRLLLRYSGTEPLARIMIEGRDQDEIESQASHLARVIHNNLG